MQHVETTRSALIQVRSPLPQDAKGAQPPLSAGDGCLGGALLPRHAAHRPAEMPSCCMPEQTSWRRRQSLLRRCGDDER
jgi:hypothetical protein